MKLTIRRVRPIDIGPLYLMIRDFEAEMPVPHPLMDADEVEKQMMWILGTLDDQAYIYLIAYDGRKPTGYMLAYMQEHAFGKPRLAAVAQELYVVPEKRGYDVAARLIRVAAGIAVTLGAETFESAGLYGRTDKMWAKLGFKPYLVYGYMDKPTMDKFLGRLAKLPPQQEDVDVNSEESSRQEGEVTQSRAGD